MNVNENNTFDNITKDKFRDIVNTCLPELIGKKIDRENVVNSLSRIISYPILMEHFSFKVVKGISSECENSKAFLYYKDFYVCVEIDEVKEENETIYILSKI